jgi:LytR cell envelope-related transcriptional attenuator
MSTEDEDLYRDEELEYDPYRRRRRRAAVKTAITFLVLIGLLVGAGYWGWQQFAPADRAASSRTANASPCAGRTHVAARSTAKAKTKARAARHKRHPAASKKRSHPSALPPPRVITVNVYNSTDRDGLAADTAVTMQNRGFHVDRIANDPLGRHVLASAQVRYGPKGAAAARVVAAYVARAGLLRVHRKGRAVDLVLGQRFRFVRSAATARASLRAHGSCS